MSPGPVRRSGTESAQRGAVARANAARLLAECCSPPFPGIDGLLSEADALPATRELVFGVLRHYFSLREIVSAHLAKPLAARDQDVLCLLLVGAYQLADSHTAAHAAVNETVEAARNLGKPWASGLVNGVLRSLQRRHQEGVSLLNRSIDLPGWLEHRIRREYPTQARELFLSFLDRPPMTIRINVLKQSVAEYLALLDAMNVSWKASWLPESVTLDRPIRQQELPGYADGAVSVQDAAAQFAARLLSVPEGGRVLDTCAAPGGKLFHLMERHPKATFVALESSSDRLEWLLREAKRLCQTERLLALQTDARNADWWDGQMFDRILLDAPCTGLGTLRRHPDIKLHRIEGDAGASQLLQRGLLSSAWRFLAPGGLLLYVTCSILAEENDDVVQPFLAAQSDASATKMQLPAGFATAVGWQTLPTEPRTDGLYFSLLQKA